MHMSLVERALKKIQESRAAQAAEAGAANPAATAARVDQVAMPQPAVKREPRDPSRIVHIDRAALQSAALLPPTSQERLLADQYRQIKRPLIANAFGRGGQALDNARLMMIASALPGEGKTFTTINLALSIAAEKDVSVVLVDADVAKPNVSALFGIAREPGLLDVLREEHLDVESVILDTDVPRFSLLSAGKRSETATELLASVRMQEVVRRLVAADPNRIVLFDSPPLLLTSEARVISSIVGQVVMVVRAGATSQQAVLDALDMLGEGKYTGLVLNHCDEQSTGYYAYYGGGSEQSAPAA
jgi:protein-tyrosine kinase